MHIAKANVLAMPEILKVNPSAIFIQSEPIRQWYDAGRVSFLYGMQLEATFYYGK